MRGSTRCGDSDRQAGAGAERDPGPREHVNDRVSGCAVIGHVNQCHDRVSLLNRAFRPIVGEHLRTWWRAAGEPEPLVSPCWWQSLIGHLGGLRRQPALSSVSTGEAGDHHHQTCCRENHWPNPAATAAPGPWLFMAHLDVAHSDVCFDLDGR